MNALQTLNLTTRVVNPSCGTTQELFNMTHTAQIKYIAKTPRNDPYHPITHVGGFITDVWKLPLNDAITKIERGEWQFYVERPAGHRVWVKVAISRFGHKYLKTETDGETPDNLLALPQFP